MKKIVWAFFLLFSFHLGFCGIHLTIYQRDLVYVDDIRDVNVEKGSHFLRLEGLFSGLFVSSLQIEPVKPTQDVVTQSIQFYPDNFTLEALFLESIGSWISFFSGRDRIEGKLLRVSEDHLFIQSDTTIDRVDMYEKNGLGWVTVDGNDVSKKSVTSAIWSYESKITGKITIRIRYLVKGLNWRASHKILRTSENSGLLNTTFSIENTSYTNFQTDSIRLVAGNPNLSTDDLNFTEVHYADIGGLQTTDFSNFGFEIYSIRKPITFQSRQDIHLPYLMNIPVQIQEEYEIVSNQPTNTFIQSVWTIQPSLSSGQSISWGEIALYADYHQKEVFLGEGYAPFVNPGGSFTVKANQVVTASVKKNKIGVGKKPNGSKFEHYQYTIFHSEKRPMKYRIREKFYGNWEIQLFNSQTSTIQTVQPDATTLELLFTVRPNSKFVVEYEILYHP